MTAPCAAVAANEKVVPAPADTTLTPPVLVTPMPTPTVPALAATAAVAPPETPPLPCTIACTLLPWCGAAASRRRPLLGCSEPDRRVFSRPGPLIGTRRQAGAVTLPMATTPEPVTTWRAPWLSGAIVCCWNPLCDNGTVPATAADPGVGWLVGEAAPSRGSPPVAFGGTTLAGAPPWPPP